MNNIVTALWQFNLMSLAATYSNPVRGEGEAREPWSKVRLIGGARVYVMIR